MKITQSSVPGGGVLHDIRARGGDAFRILVEPAGERVLIVDDASDPERQPLEIVMEPDESDAVAEILHSSPIVDRVASLERRLDELGRRARDVGPPGTS